MERQEIFEKVKEVMKDKLGSADINESSRLDEDLRADSLTKVEILMGIEEVFKGIGDISDDDAAELKTVGDIVNYLQKHLKEADPAPA